MSPLRAYHDAAGPTVLVCADAGSWQRERITAAVRMHAPQAYIEECVPNELASRLVSPAGGWDLIVVAQAWPEQYERELVATLIDRCATARLLVVYGPWCESDGRTRSIWPPAARVPEIQLEHAVGRELRIVAGEAAPIPFTAARDELFAARVEDAGERAPESALSLSVLIGDRVLRETLSAALVDAGHRIVASTESACDVIVVDLDDPVATSAAAALCGKHGARCLGLTDSATAGEQSENASYLVVLGKLSPLSQTLDAIRRAVVSRRLPVTP